jgi:hypothetical protein
MNKGLSPAAKVQHVVSHAAPQVASRVQQVVSHAAPQVARVQQAVKHAAPQVAKVQQAVQHAAPQVASRVQQVVSHAAPQVAKVQQAVQHAAPQVARKVQPVIEPASHIIGSTPAAAKQVTYQTVPQKQVLPVAHQVSPGTVEAGSKKLRFYDQEAIRDPYAQISNSGFTPVGNLKTYGVANMYDRSEPTKLRDLKELYTVPYNTTPFLGTNTTSIKYVDDDSTILRYPVFQNKKSAIDTSQVTIYPAQQFINNPNVSPEMNTFYEQATTINLLDKDNYTYSKSIDPNLPGLGQDNYGLESTRYINRWNIVDPRVVQNVNNIIMNVKNSNGDVISLKPCGISTRNELRNYVEVNNC